MSYWEKALRRVGANDNWRKALDAEYWIDKFTMGREFVRFLDNEFSEDKAVLGELGLTK